jgi:hypothetical protein
MVPHEAVRNDVQTMLRGVSPEKIEIDTAVAIGEEHVLATVPPLSDMVWNVRHDDTRDSRHAPMLTPNLVTINDNTGSVPCLH